jgi:hypothetical protein
MAKRSKSKTLTLNCDNCGRKFKRFQSLTKGFKHAFCCRRCGFDYKIKTGQILQAQALAVRFRQSNLTGKIVRCAECNKEVYRYPYVLARFKNNFCGRQCAIAHRIRNQQARRHIETCRVCGKDFFRMPSRTKYNHGHHYCSAECKTVGRSGTGHHFWKGGRRLREDGYIDISAAAIPPTLRSVRKDRRMLEHRLVMAQHLGRPLFPHEIIHHRNGDRADNRIDNLELHNAHEHNGITQSENRRIRELESEIAQLQKELGQLKKDSA